MLLEIAAAKEAELKVCLINREGATEGGCQAIRSLEELLGPKEEGVGKRKNEEAAPEEEQPPAKLQRIEEEGEKEKEAPPAETVEPMEVDSAKTAPAGTF